MTITNTIIASHSIAIAQANGTVTEDYNLFFGNTENLSGTITSGGHSLTGNPAFENPASDDYHLTTTSAAYNTGTNAGVTSDFEGKPRPQGGGFDIGFDEVTIQAAPLANDDTATTLEDIGLTITVLNNDNDPNGDPLSLAAIGAAQHGTTAISGATAVYTPALNFAGTDSFTYTASDGTLTGTARVTVTVTPSNDGPIVGATKVLYQGVSSETPDNQGFFYFPVGSASNTATSGVTTLDTSSDNSTQAGYSGTTPFVPTLNRATGYTVRFTAQISSENHTGSDRNGDGVDDRAGFSVIALSSDKRGIELGFWINRIWAQNGGAPVTAGGTLFTQGEGAAFDTTAGLIPYELRVLGGAYSLAVGSTEILSGSLRDYTAFTGFPDVYENSNYLFFGDDTTSARASMRLSLISVLTNTTLPDRTVASGGELVVDKLGLLDVDAGGQTGVVTLTVNSGVITLTTSAPNGLTTGQINGNGTGTVVVTGSLAQINNSLAFTPALIYRSNAGFLGGDSLTVTINDQGHTGGGALTGQKSFNINVQAAELGVTKTVNTLTPLAGQRITYTLVVSNAGNLNVTGATLSDNLSASLTFAGPISLDPAGAGTIGTPPHIVTNLTVTAGQRITVTLPVTVNLNLNPGAQITNTATISSPMTEALPANNSGTVVITLANPNSPANSTYLPLIVKSD